MHHCPQIYIYIYIIHTVTVVQPLCSPVPLVARTRLWTPEPSRRLIALNSSFASPHLWVDVPLPRRVGSSKWTLTCCILHQPTQPILILNLLTNARGVWFDLLLFAFALSSPRRIQQDRIFPWVFFSSWKFGSAAPEFTLINETSRLIAAVRSFIFNLWTLSSPPSETAATRQDMSSNQTSSFLLYHLFVLQSVIITPLQHLVGAQDLNENPSKPVLTSNVKKNT